MKKGILILILLILALFSVSCIYAADVNDTQVASEDIGEIELSHENEMESTDNNLKTSEEQIVTQTDNEEKIGETADETLNIGNPKIHGMLDDQIVSLELASTVKNQSEVHILSCNDIKYPDSLNVTYEITHMSNCIYVIKDSQGEIVKQGNIASPNSLCVEGLKPGSYSILINNTGSQYILPSSANTTFSVLKGSFDLRIVVFNETYPDMAECNLYSNGADAYDYVLTVTGDSGIIYSKTVNFNNMTHFDMMEFDAGDYTAKISFIGNEYYNPVSNLTSFTVFREGISFEIEIVPGEIDYGGIAKVIPVFGDNVNGTVVYHLHNGTFLAELSAGENLTLPLLDVGHYVIIANYSGDRDHEPAFDSAHIIVNKAKPVFKIEGDSVRYGENATVIAILPSTATGTVRYYWANGTFLGEAAVNENLTLPVLDAGSYLIIANYSGDKNFINATATGTLTVNKANSTLTINDVVLDYGTSANVTVTTDGTTGIIAKINDKEAVVENSTISIPVLDVGTYTLTVTTIADSNHNNITKNVTITVNKAKTQINAKAVTATYNVNKNLVITLKDSTGKALSGVKITVKLKGSKTYTTDKNGQVKINIAKLVPKKYTAKVTFAGNANYLKSTADVKVTVKKAKAKIFAKKKTYKANKKSKKFKIKLKDKNGKAIKKAKVRLIVKKIKKTSKGKSKKSEKKYKKNIKKTNKKGKITFKINRNKKGKYLATVKFYGNKYYAKAVKKVKIKMK